MLAFIFIPLVLSVFLAFAVLIAAGIEAAFGKAPAFGPDEEPDVDWTLAQPSRASVPAAGVSRTARGHNLAGTAAVIAIIAVGLSATVSRASKSRLDENSPKSATAEAVAVIASSKPNLPHPLGPRDDDARSLSKGSAERGHALFLSGRLACPGCHTIERDEESFCPNLSAVGSRLPRERIISSILDPSRDIAPGYQRVTLTMNDGRTISGFLKAETDTTLELRIDDETVRANKSDVDSRVNEKSDMPEGLAKNLSPQEFSDLVEFLASQRG